MIVYPTIFSVSYKPVNLCHNQQCTQDHQPLDQRHTVQDMIPRRYHPPWVDPRSLTRPPYPKRNVPRIKNGVVDQKSSLRCMTFTKVVQTFVYTYKDVYIMPIHLAQGSTKRSAQAVVWLSAVSASPHVATSEEQFLLLVAPSASLHLNTLIRPSNPKVRVVQNFHCSSVKTTKESAWAGKLFLSAVQAHTTVPLGFHVIPAFASNAGFLPSTVGSMKPWLNQFIHSHFLWVICL